MVEAISVRPLKYTDRVVGELQKKIEETKLTKNIWPIVGGMGMITFALGFILMGIPPGTHIAEILPSFIPESALLAIPALIPASGIIAAIKLKLENRKYRNELKAAVADRETIRKANLEASRTAHSNGLKNNSLVKSGLADQPGGPSTNFGKKTQPMVCPAKKTAGTPSRPARRRGGPKGPALDKT